MTVTSTISLGGDPDRIACEFGGALYTHPAYLAARGIEEVIRVPGACGAALFVRSGACLFHLGRLDRLDEAETQRMASVLLNEHDADFVIFDDIELTPCGRPQPLPAVRFDFHSNWRLGIAPGELTVSSRRRRQLRKLDRRFAKSSGAELHFHFGAADDAFVDAVVALSRETVRQAGRRHHLSEDKVCELKSIGADVCRQALLFCGDRLVAGNIVCVAGRRAYVMISAYDTRYAEFSPGVHTHIATMEHLQALGYEEANFLWGDTPLKSRIGARRQPLTTLAIARTRRALLSPRFWASCSGYAAATARAFVKRRILRR